MAGQLAALLLGLQLTASAVAPTGTLRASFLGNNPVQAHVDERTGAITGPVADLVAELARRLGVPFTLIPEPNAAEVVASVRAHRADIGFLGYEAARAEQVAFSEPYALMQSTYVVRADLPVRRSADIDRPGISVGAVTGQSMQIWASANLKNARVQVLPTTPPAEEIARLIESGALDAFASNRARMEDVAARSTRLRVLPDNFLSVGQAIVVDNADRARLELVNRFVDDVRSSGFVRASLDRAKIAGVDVPAGSADSREGPGRK